MKDRHFPASFWLQPNRPSANVRQPLPPGARRGELLETRTHAIRIPTPPDTNLLFSLFKIHELQLVRSSTATGLVAVAELQQRVRSPHGVRRSGRPVRRRDRSHNIRHGGAAVSSSTAAATARLPDVVAQSMLMASMEHIGGCDASDDVDDVDDVDDDRDTISSSEDPYLTVAGTISGGRKAHELLLLQASEQRRRSMLTTMLSAPGGGVGGAGGDGGRDGDGANGQVGSSSSCYSDLLSDLVVNL